MKDLWWSCETASPSSNAPRRRVYIQVPKQSSGFGTLLVMTWANGCRWCANSVSALMGRFVSEGRDNQPLIQVGWVGRLHYLGASSVSKLWNVDLTHLHFLEGVSGPTWQIYRDPPLRASEQLEPTHPREQIGIAHLPCACPGFSTSVGETHQAELRLYVCDGPQSEASSSTEEAQTVDVPRSCHHHLLSHPAASDLQVGEIASLICFRTVCPKDLIRETNLIYLQSEQSLHPKGEQSLHVF